MKYYVSTPTGEATLSICRAHGFREMSCPIEWRLPKGDRAGYIRKRNLRVRLDHFALDNGGWIFHVAKREADWTTFEHALREMGEAADFVVVPDVVAGGAASLALSRAWLPRVLEHTRVALLAVQDGMVPDEVRADLGERVGIFVGGSFHWKWTHVRAWAQLARETGCHIHVGRVNTINRASHCADLGIDSADGSSVSRFASTASRFIDATNPNRKGQENMPW